MRIRQTIVHTAVDRPKGVMTAILLFTLVLAAMIPWVTVDTDPENMLSEDEAVRIFHTAMKKEFSLYDMVVVGVVNEQHPQGVFNVESLGKVHALTEYAKTLQWPAQDGTEADTQKFHGVVRAEIIAPSTMDNITQGGLGVVRFEELMGAPPVTEQEALRIRDQAQKMPFLDGTIVSDDGKAIALFLPLTSKDWSYQVYSKIREKVASFAGPEQYYVTGLPVAEDTFGVEMFVQMAICAPLAMAVVFGLLVYFFRNVVLVTAPMVVAMTSVLATMGLLIGTGHTVHIMSSMIPIFIMPIAVLDSVHILSEFFDRYQASPDQAADFDTQRRTIRRTLLAVMDELFVPMLYTSLTSAAGFGSLVLASVPPVQVFGIFVALGIMLAWIFTITFIPAFIMYIDPARLADFGAAARSAGQSAQRPLLSRFLHEMGQSTFRRAPLILGITAGVFGLAL